MSSILGSFILGVDKLAKETLFILNFLGANFVVQRTVVVKEFSIFNIILNSSGTEFKV
jgi:hypothetical protein